MTIPNLLTFFRIFLTPLLACFLVNRWMNAAFGVFFVAGMTDVLDGLLARALHQKSRLGAFVDPLADKLLLVSSFLLLWKIGEVPLWLVVVAVGRDLMILTGIFVLLVSQVQFEVKPLLSSKLTTLFQLGTVFALLGKSILGVPEWAFPTLFVTTAGFSVLSGGQYVSKGVSMLKRHRSGIDAGNCAGG